MIEELNVQEMNEIKGGVSREEYCSQLRKIIKENDLDEGAKEGAAYGWNKAECGKYYSDVEL